MARGFENLLSYEGEDLEDTFMLTFNITYTGQFGETVNYNLMENEEDTAVTKENRKVCLIKLTVFLYLDN